MMVLVVYDIDMEDKISGAKRLRNIAKLCERYGVRVQNSVFEMIVDFRQYKEIRKSIFSGIDTNKDSVRYYIMGNKWEGKVECDGKNNEIKAGDVLILWKMTSEIHQ